VFAGADHTGRTTPLTHHVMAEVATARRDGFSAATLVTAAWPLLRSAWPDDPQWIDPPHDVSPAMVRTVPAAWMPFLPWLTGTLIDFARTGKAVVLVTDPDQAADTPAGLLAVLSLLPPSLQWSATLATHAVAVGDFIREAGLLVTYPDAPLLDQCRQRRDSRAPLILDLTRSPQVPNLPAGDWGEMLRRAATHEAAQRSAEQFDNFGLAAADVPTFAAATVLVADIVAAPAGATGDEWKAMVRRIAALKNPPVVGRWVAEAAAEAVRSLAADENSATRWQTLAAVATDTAWPEVARREAAEKLLDGGPDALDAVAQLNGKADAAGDVFRPAIQKRPSLSRTLLAATANGDNGAARRAAFVLSHSILGRDEGHQAIVVLHAASPAIQQSLRPAVIRSLAAGMRDADEIVSLADAHNDARRSIVIPLLLNRLRHTNDGHWQTLEARYRDCVIADGLRQPDYIDLFKEFGPSMRRGINAWLTHPNLNESQRQSVRTAAEFAGIIAPVVAQPATPSAGEWRAAPPSNIGTAADGEPLVRVSFGSAGPVRTGLYLSFLVIVSSGLSGFSLYIDGQGSGWTRHWELIFALACVGLWAAAEVFFRLIIRSPQQLAFARWGRRCVVLLLLVAIPVAALPAVTIWKSHGHELLAKFGLADAARGKSQ
jgi:hypothetical protein